MKKELSVFVDESGMFGDFNAPTKNYQITFVFHDQSNSIMEEATNLKKFLKSLGLSKNYYVHTGPLIYNKDENKNISGNERRKILMKLFTIYNKMDISHVSFNVERKYITNPNVLHKEFVLRINEFIERNRRYFKDFDVIKIYYDRGQSDVTDIIKHSLCKSLSNADFKNNVSQKNYILFQIADMVCTLEMLEYKYKNNSLTKSEINFFRNRKILTKLYLKPLQKKRLK